MKKMNNKGFSLVELIIVIAIMAILIAVLAPQYLRYVEKSRLQSDNSAIGEVANACKVAVADTTINAEVKTTPVTALTIPNATAGPCTGAGTHLADELNNVVGQNLLLKSNAYKNNSFTIGVSVGTNGVAIVTGSNYVTDVGATPINTTF